MSAAQWPHPNSTMMGRRMDGGCGTEERPCPISTSSSRSRARVASSTPSSDPATVDLLSQARKALSDRHPFVAAGAPPLPATLPVAFAAFLSRCSDRRRKHNKPQSDHHKSSPRCIWTETEPYFRHLTLSDIESLASPTSLLPLSSDPLLRVPPIPPNLNFPLAAPTAPRDLATAAPEPLRAVDRNLMEVDSSGSLNVARGNEAGSLDLARSDEAVSDLSLNSNSDLGLVAARSREEVGNLDLEPTLESNDLHWLFGSRQKVLLTSERPSKKRRLLGGEAGLDRLVALGPSHDGSSISCHACSSGDCTQQVNQFLVCGSCGVCVHKRCNGVSQFSAVGWFCAHCSRKRSLESDSTGSLCESEAAGSSPKSCLLCPKEGGVLKPVDKDVGNFVDSSNVKFAHLFCSLWMPEVYVENTQNMEPVMNIGGIKETRRRLVCFLCKVKYGVCIRCSHGTCRTSFHPICAREANLRMEIWGKFGCDNVELRAFCVKHSGSLDTGGGPVESTTSDATVGSSESNHLLTSTPAKRSYKIKLGRTNRDNSIVDVKNTTNNSDDHSKDRMTLEVDSLVTSDSLGDSGDTRIIVNEEKPMVTERAINGDNNSIDSVNLVLILNKLINEGKVCVNDIATGVGIPADSLAAILVDERAPVLPEWRTKLAQWLRWSNGAGISCGAKEARLDAPTSAKVEEVADKCNDGVNTLSLLPMRRGKIKIVKGNKIVCTAGETNISGESECALNNEVSENKLLLSEDAKKDSIKNEHALSDTGYPNKESLVTGEDLGISCCNGGAQNVQEPPSCLDTGSPIKTANSNIVEACGQQQTVIEEKFLGGLCNGHAEEANALQNYLVKSSGEQDCAAVDIPDIRNGESASSSYIHPLINKRLIQMLNCLFLKQNRRNPVSDGLNEKGMSSMEATCSVDIGGTDQAWHSSSTDMTCVSDNGSEEQLDKARKLGILELSPVDEVEGEILYCQNRLLDNAVASKHQFEDLIFRVVANISHELDELRKQRWDAVLINQYLREVREAKRRGRKERRHREAQAVLAAATAAAAASSRVSFLRKDSHDEMTHAAHECRPKVNIASGRARSQSHLLRAKETHSRLAVPKLSSGQNLQSDLSKEYQQTCDICGRNETPFNQILICCNCKVSVHLVCYNSHKGSFGPWYCELCEEVGRDRSCLVEQCGLCGGTSGAFRKTVDSQWVHAFCAEWILESTFRRGQPNLVEGLEVSLKDRDRLMCFICHSKHGACLKCNYEDCQHTFHPTCARNAGFYMKAKSFGGKLQRSAYCENHSMGQREKDENEQHGIEELCRLKQIRVELEKVRLLCERIIKREKLKRDLVLCSHEILASRMHNVAFSVLVRSSFLPSDVSSESVTTSLKGQTDDSKSCSEAIQRSDDITEDSTVSRACRSANAMNMDVDGKTDNCSSSHRTRKPTYRVSFSGKQLPHRSASLVSQNIYSRDKRLKSRKCTETFQKEVIMTSDQASMKNQRLPKGYVYVPICSLPKEKSDSHEMESHESLEPGG